MKIRPLPDQGPGLFTLPAGRAAARLAAVALAAAFVLPATAPGVMAAAKDKKSAGETWPEITAEEKALKKLTQDPDADAVVLNHERNGKILRKGDDITNVLNYHWRMKILTERGKRYAEVAIPAEKYSRVSNIHARTVKSDGTVVPVPADQIFEKVVMQAGGYNLTQWVFNFPAVEPGAIIEYRYDRHDDFLLFIDPFYFEEEEYTLRAKVTQAIPGNFGYMALADLCTAKPTITDWREGSTKGRLYTLELRDLPGYRDEIFMPPLREVSPRLELVLHTARNFYWEELGRQDTLFTDWASVARFVDARYQKTIREGQSALKPVVEGWVQGISDPQQKVRAIVRHVQQDFRYIPWNAIAGWSRKIDDLLKDRTADNEEKAVLVIAALKSAGIEADAALVSGRHRGPLNPNFFSPSQFTHTVVILPASGGTQWIDPTVAYAPYAFMPWKDAGAGALLLKGGKGELVDLPQKVELSATRLRVTLKPRQDGRADAEVEAEFLGEDAIEMRDALAPAAETARVSFLQAWLKEHREGAALRSHAIEDLQDVEKPLRIKMVIEAPGLVTLADDLTLVRGCVLTCREYNPISRRARQHPFYVDRGWNLDETVTIVPGDGLETRETPAAASVRSEIASLSLSCLPQADGARCTRQFAARRSRWPAEIQENARKMYDQIVAADRATVAFGPPSGAAAGTEGGH